MITLILGKTSKRLQIMIDRCAQKIASNSKYGFIRKTDATEIYALIGLVCLRGLLGQNNHSQKYLFRDKMGHPIFQAVVSKNRFTLLLSNLMFDDMEERAANWHRDLQLYVIFLKHLTGTASIMLFPPSSFLLTRHYLQ